MVIGSADADRSRIDKGITSERIGPAPLSTVVLKPEKTSPEVAEPPVIAPDMVTVPAPVPLKVSVLVVDPMRMAFATVNAPSPLCVICGARDVLKSS